MKFTRRALKAHILYAGSLFAANAPQIPPPLAIPVPAPIPVPVAIPIPAQNVTQPPPPPPTMLQTVTVPIAPEDTTHVTEALDTEIVLEETHEKLSVSDMRGNWFEKRKALRDARQVYEKIRQLEVNVQSNEKILHDKVTASSEEIEKFLIETAPLQGALNALLQEYTERMEQERKKEGQLTEEERAISTEIKTKKEAAEGVKAEFSTLGTLQKTLIEAFETYLKQLALAHDYEKKSWENYEKIAEVLNEQTALQLLADMQTASDNIAAINSYIQGSLTEYFNQTQSKISEKTKKISQEIATLKEKNVELDKKTTELIELAAQAKQKKIAPATIKPTNTQSIEGWLTIVLHWFTTIWQKIMGLFI